MQLLENGSIQLYDNIRRCLLYQRITVTVESRSIGDRRFCGGIASDARGLISRDAVRTLMVQMMVRTVGDSNSTLISNKGPSLPQDMDCSTAISSACRN